MVSEVNNFANCVELCLQEGLKWKESDRKTLFDKVRVVFFKLRKLSANIYKTENGGLEIRQSKFFGLPREWRVVQSRH